MFFYKIVDFYRGNKRKYFFGISQGFRKVSRRVPYFRNINLVGNEPMAASTPLLSNSEFICRLDRGLGLSFSYLFNRGR